MGMPRIFTENGGKLGFKEQGGTIRGSQRRYKRAKLYNKYAQKQVTEAFGDYHSWSVFKNEHTPTGLNCGKLTGTTVLRKACVKLLPLDSCA